MIEEEKIDVFPFIEGENIDLVVVNSKWASLVAKWINNPKVRQYLRNEWPLTLEQIKKFFEPSPSQSAKELIVFTIFHKKDKRPIGSIGFNHINWISRKAEIFYSIGELQYWGRGIVGEAAKLIINYGFTELNFHKICAGVYSLNKRSLRVVEKLGFKEEAVLKDDIYVDGKYMDTHMFAFFKKDWMRQNNFD